MGWDLETATSTLAAATAPASELIPADRSRFFSEAAETFAHTTVPVLDTFEQPVSLFLGDRAVG
jgi:hypothetical protein